MKKPRSKLVSSVTQRPGKPAIGSAASSKPPSALMPKKGYKKKGANADAFGEISFGQTAMTGES